MIAVLLATSLTACSTDTAPTPSSASNNENNATPIIQDEVLPQIDYPTTTQKTDEWRFRYNENAGGIIIEECLCANKHGDDIIKSKDSDIVIPSTFEGFEGLNVVGIGANAFHNMVMKSLAIPDTVTSIGKRAFSNAEVLEALTIPSSVTEIGEECFYHYRGEEVVLPPLEAVGSFMFSYSNVKKVVISEGTKVITNFAFNECIGLEELIIPNSVEEIAQSSLPKSCAIAELTLPDNLKVFDVSTSLPMDNAANSYLIVIFKGEVYDFPSLVSSGWGSSRFSDEYYNLAEKLQQEIDNNT